MTGLQSQDGLIGARRPMMFAETVSLVARTLAAAFTLGLAACAHLSGPVSNEAILWRFDNLSRVDGLDVRLEGNPALIRTGAGQAVRFDGVDDALFLDSHPLAGAATFTIEAIFRPDGGAFEQRWLHLAEADPAAVPGNYPPVAPSGPRFMFEIRVVEAGWYLDAFAAGPGYNQALMAPEKLHPIGRWYHVAQTFDGRTYRSFVDGILQAEAPLAFTQQGRGYASIGTRINRRSYFNGAVHSARFTRRALQPAEFQKLPAGLR